MATDIERIADEHRLQRILSARLSNADDEAFLRLTWAVNALQTGRAPAAHTSLSNVPIGAATEGILGPYAIYPWELDTLANELLTTPKHPHYRTFDCRSWSALTGLVNNLRALEEAQYNVRREEISIFRELGSGLID